MGLLVAATRTLLLACVLAATAVHATPAPAPPPGGGARAGTQRVEALLEEAEAVRSASPARLAALLVELEASAREATPAQREHITYLRAYHEAFSGRYAPALAEARRLVETTRDPTLRLRARALIVTVHGLSRQFAEGLRELEALHGELPQVADASVQRQALFASGGLYVQVGQYALAMRDLDQLLEQTAPVPPRELCFTNQLRQEASQAAGQPATEADLQAIVDQCIAAGEPLLAGIARLALAKGRRLAGRLDDAIAYVYEHLDSMQATAYPRLMTDVHSTLAEWLAARGDVAGARRHANRAIAEASGEQSLLPLTTAHRVLYELAEAEGDARTALYHYRRYTDADRAYLDDVKAREFAYQIVRRETQQQHQQIELLDQQNQVLVLQQQVSRQAAQNTRLLIALLVVLLAMIGYWAWRVTRRHNSLRRLAEVDSLTGVDNRRHFLLQAEQALAAADRGGGVVALVMFDLDHFKQINDSYGHVTGDWVLARVATACRELCRREDVLGRLGGEEFAILLPGRDAGEAAGLAERCRARISAMDTTGSGHAFALAASFGVTDTARSGYTLSRLLSHADQALYLAKHAGRDRVSVHDA